MAIVQVRLMSAALGIRVMMVRIVSLLIGEAGRRVVSALLYPIF
jgi:hypothetical protein